MTIQLTDDVRLRLDGHLDAVERALAAAGSSRERRRGVVDDLEAQILDMLGAKSSTPTVADLEEVLGKLDPPGAYGEGAGAMVRTAGTVASATATPGKPHYSRTAIWGFVCILVSLLPLLFMAVVLYLRLRNNVLWQ